MDQGQVIVDPQVEMVALLDIDDTVYGVRADRSDDRTVELAKSIKSEGLVNPLSCVRRDGRSIVVAGHRRYVACEMAGLARVPVIHRELNEVEAQRLVFAENFFRENPTPMEEASAMYRAIDSGAASEEDLAEGFHRSVQWVRDRIKLLSFPEDCQDVLHDGTLAVSSVRHLAKIRDDEQRRHLLAHAVASGINERTARAWWQAWQASIPVEAVILEDGGPGRYVPLDRAAQCPCLVCDRLAEPGTMTNVMICRGCVDTIRARA